MAIGLGKMFGFEFKKILTIRMYRKAQREFWRRWHISLGTWFREYVYIPLGGNRCSVSRNIFNLMVVIGVCAVLATVNVAKETIKRDIPLSLICAALLMLLGIIGLGDKSGMTLGHLDGVILLGFFAGYIFYMIKIALKASREGRKVEIEGV